MSKSVMTLELAQEEVNKWIEYKKLDEDEIEEKEAQIKTLVTAMKNGRLVLDKDFNLIQTLKFPLAKITELKYAARIDVDSVAMKVGLIDSSNLVLLMTAYASASCGVTTGVIGKLDTADNKIAQAIGTFFL